MTTTYRSVTTTPGGSLVITNTETAVHILLKGTAVGFTVSFDDAQNFTADRLYRFTNNSTQDVALANFTATITATLLPGNVLQATLTDETTAAGDWNFKQHVSGTSSKAGMATDYDLVEYAALAGRSGGQTLAGGTDAGDHLVFLSTAHATKGKIIFGTDIVIDEASDNVGIGLSAWGTSAAKVLGIANGTAPTTSPVDAVQIWAADCNGTGGKSGLHIRSEDATSYVLSDYFGIGTLKPSAIVDIERAGTAKSIVDFLEITNTVNASDMDGTGSAIKFRQFYYDPVTPAVVDSAIIAAIALNDWDSSDQYSAITFSTTASGSCDERARITFDGSLLIGGMTEATIQTNALQLFRGYVSEHVDDSIHIYADQVGGEGMWASVLGLVCECAVTSETVTSDRTIPVKINGVEYKWMLKS